VLWVGEIPPTPVKEVPTLGLKGADSMGGQSGKPGERVLGTMDFIWLWFGMTAQMGVFMLGASFAGRLSFVSAMAAILLGNAIVSVILILNGDVGTRYGINFSVFLRAPFGRRGALLPVIARALTGVFWFGIQTYFGARAINIAVEYLTGYSNWFLWYLLFGFIQIWITAGGIKWIKYLENIAAPALGVLSVWLIYILLRQNSFSALLNAEITNPLPFWVAITANLSYWVTVAVNISDFTRHVKTDGSTSFYKRNKISIMGQLPGITIGMAIFAAVGMIGGFFTGNGNPVEIISATLGGGFMLFGLLIILLAQLSTNVAANLYAAGNIIGYISGNKLNFSWAVVVGGLVGLCTFPWLMLDHFLTYLPMIGATLAPLPGIMLTDYYLLRRGRLNISDFTSEGDAYSYWRGVNPGAILTYLVAGLIGIRYLEYSWLVSMPTAMVMYYVLMKCWILKRFPHELRLREGA
jgi:NCS1 family nucleobase:cation symporter-1